MRHALYAMGAIVFLLSGALWAQQWRDWTGASNNYTILYRYRVLNGKACDMEFKDENQGDSYTTFDAAVDYQSSASQYDNTRVLKTNNVHVVTALNHNGVAQVPNCFGVSEVRVSFVQRR
jgi:hypothetical protein